MELSETGEGHFENREESSRNRFGLTDRLRDWFGGFGKEKAAEARRRLRENLRYLRHAYGIRLEMGKLTDEDKPHIASLKKLTLLEAVPVVQAVREEIAKYPPEYIRFCDVHRLRIAKGLKERTKRGGETGMGGRSTSKNPGRARRIWVGDTEDLSFFRGSLHHELFHRSDFGTSEGRSLRSLFGLVWEALTDSSLDKNWASLNPGGASVYWREEKNIPPTTGASPRGFANEYGMKNEWEDRATVAELLMTNPAEAKARESQDKVLRAKIKTIRRLFEERSCGRMNAQYFDDLSAGRVKEGYWESKREKDEIGRGKNK